MGRAKELKIGEDKLTLTEFERAQNSFLKMKCFYRYLSVVPNFLRVLHMMGVPPFSSSVGHQQHMSR